MGKLFFPINLPGHWVLAVVYMSTKTIVLYDSKRSGYKTAGMKELRSILQWLVDESMDKKHKPHINPDEWKLILHPPDVPQQIGGVDCGMFTIMCCDFLADDLPLNYTQSDVAHWRLKVGCDIIRGHLCY
jgi:sentrin-specific protease 1